MKRRDVISLVSNIAEDIADDLEFDLVDTEYVKDHGNFFLRVYIDKPGGITVDDCQKMSEALGKKLDEDDPIKDAYYLEVSSPGLDRPLKSDKDLKRNLGKDVEIGLYKGFKGKKTYKGKLEDFTEDSILISNSEEGENITSIPKDIVSIVKLTIKF